MAKNRGITIPTRSLAAEADPSDLFAAKTRELNAAHEKIATLEQALVDREAALKAANEKIDTLVAEAANQAQLLETAKVDIEQMEDRWKKIQEEMQELTSRRPFVSTSEDQEAEEEHVPHKTVMSAISR